MSVEITEDRIARQPPEAQEIIRAVVAENAELKARLARLEEQMNQTPRNSSKPPSSEHPHAKPPKKRSKKKPKRKRGGQKGHPKHERPLIPSEDCHTVIPLRPGACRRCGESLAGDDPTPLRHQVWEIPEIKPVVTEYRRHRLRCPCCGESTCAELPQGVPPGQSGPRLVAFTALLMAYFRQSKRRAALFLEALLGQPACPALMVKHQKLATGALRPGYEELAAALPDQGHLNADESPTKEGTSRAWLWDFVAEKFTVFAVRRTRGARVLKEMLTERFCGIITCDRAKMYWSLGREPPEPRTHRLQWCWEHLKRDMQALIDSLDGQVKRLGRDLMRPTETLFAIWDRYRNGEITRTGMKRLLVPVREDVKALLLRGAFSGNERLEGMCWQLYEHRRWLWTFLEHEGVEPTNNAAERALRHAVIWRKLSFGTQSPSGSRFVETMLTVIETCRQQSRDVFAYVTAAVEAHFTRQDCPSLLPGA